jgi:predicted lipoprotein with Yx(FWY)xxD motif
VVDGKFFAPQASLEVKHLLRTIVDRSPPNIYTDKELDAMNKSALFVFAPVVAAVAIAGCGGSGGGSGRSGTAASETGGAAPTIALAPSKLGKILVDGHGRTLYEFVADKTTASTCYGACASLWPPLAVSGAPKAGPGILASLLGTTKRTDGTTEVTYNGHPLYYFTGDPQAGETTGHAINEFGAPGYILTVNDTAVHDG